MCGDENRVGDGGVPRFGNVSNRTKDFTGSQVRMSNTTSSGTGRRFSVGRDIFVGGSI